MGYTGSTAPAHADDELEEQTYRKVAWRLVPFLLLFGAAGVVGVRTYWQNVPAGRRGVLAAGVVATVVLTAWPLLSPPLMRAITENNLGTALQAAGRYDEAIAHHQRAIALMPDYAPAYNNLGAALRAAGRLDDAIEE